MFSQNHFCNYFFIEIRCQQYIENWSKKVISNIFFVMSVNLKSNVNFQN